MRQRIASGHVLAALALAASPVALTACGSDEPTSGSSVSSTSESSEGESSATGSTANADYPDVLEAELTGDGGSYSLAVTMSSQYDTPERYADGWRVLDREGNELGEMTLSHDHASEQPFTRTQSGLEIPDDVDRIVVEGRDLENGYGGATVTLDVPS